MQRVMKSPRRHQLVGVEPPKYEKVSWADSSQDSWKTKKKLRTTSLFHLLNGWDFSKMGLARGI